MFFEHESRHVHDTGASSFLYPFLGAEAETDMDAVLADVAASVVAKGDEIAALRAQTLAEGEPVLAARRGRAACAAGPRRAAAVPGQRRLGHRRHGRRGRHALPARRRGGPSGRWT